MSPPCAAQIASEAADWLQPEVIASILEQLHALDNGDAGTASAESAIAAAEPVAMLLSTWAAALSYLNAYAAVSPRCSSNFNLLCKHADGFGTVVQLHLSAMCSSG